MAQIQESDVRAIEDFEASDLSPFIAAAESITDQLNLSNDLTNAQLKEVQRYLAAHFAASKGSEQLAQKFAKGDQRFTFQGDWGMGLRRTSHGQNAIDLDATGKLAKHAKSTKKADFASVETSDHR